MFVFTSANQHISANNTKLERENSHTVTSGAHYLSIFYYE